MHFFSSNVAPNEYVHRICVWETHAKFDIRAYYKLYFLWFCHLWMKFGNVRRYPRCPARWSAMAHLSQSQARADWERTLDPKDRFEIYRLTNVTMTSTRLTPLPLQDFDGAIRLRRQYELLKDSWNMFAYFWSPSPIPTHSPLRFAEASTKGMASLPAMLPRCLPSDEISRTFTHSKPGDTPNAKFFLMLSNVAPYAHCSYMPFRSIEILTCIAVSPFWPLVTRISTIKGARFRRQKVKVPSDNNAGKEDERTRSDRKMTRYDKWSSSEDKFAGKGMERGHNSWQQGRIRETRIKTKRMTRRKSRRKIRRETTKDKAWMVDAACSSTKKTHMENHWEHQNRIYLEEKDMFFNRYSDSKHNLTRCKTHIDSKTFQHIPAYSKIFQHMGIGQNLGYPKN